MMKELRNFLKATPSKDNKSKARLLSESPYVTLWHGTTKKNVPGIMKTGLKPVVYLTPSKSAAIIHAEAGPEKTIKGHAHVHLGENKDKGVVLKVTIPKKDIRNYELVLPNDYDAGKELKSNIYEMKVDNLIEPRNIKIVNMPKFKQRAYGEARVPERVGIDYTNPLWRSPEQRESYSEYEKEKGIKGLELLDKEPSSDEIGKNKLNTLQKERFNKIPGVYYTGNRTKTTQPPYQDVEKYSYADFYKKPLSKGEKQVKSRVLNLVKKYPNLMTSLEQKPEDIKVIFYPGNKQGRDGLYSASTKKIYIETTPRKSKIGLDKYTLAESTFHELTHAKQDAEGRLPKQTSYHGLGAEERTQAWHKDPYEVEAETRAHELSGEVAKGTIKTLHPFATQEELTEARSTNWKDKAQELRTVAKERKKEYLEQVEKNKESGMKLLDTETPEIDTTSKESLFTRRLPDDEPSNEETYESPYQTIKIITGRGASKQDYPSVDDIGYFYDNAPKEYAEAVTSIKLAPNKRGEKNWWGSANKGIPGEVSIYPKRSVLKNLRSQEDTRLSEPYKEPVIGEPKEWEYYKDKTPGLGGEVSQILVHETGHVIGRPFEEAWQQEFPLETTPTTYPLQRLKHNMRNANKYKKNISITNKLLKKEKALGFGTPINYIKDGVTFTSTNWRGDVEELERQKKHFSDLYTERKNIAETKASREDLAESFSLAHPGIGSFSPKRKEGFFPKVKPTYINWIKPEEINSKSPFEARKQFLNEELGEDFQTYQSPREEYEELTSPEYYIEEALDPRGIQGTTKTPLEYAKDYEEIKRGGYKYDALGNMINKDDTSTNKIITLYHGTSEDNIPSILKHGLRGRTYPKSKGQKLVYATKEHYQAQHFGNQEGDPRILRIKGDDENLVTANQSGNIIREIRIPDIEDWKSEDGEYLAFRGDIPKENISIVPRSEQTRRVQKTVMTWEEPSLHRAQEINKTLGLRLLDQEAIQNNYTYSEWLNAYNATKDLVQKSKQKNQNLDDDDTSKELKWVKGKPLTVYHGTKSYAVPLIQRHGLISKQELDKELGIPPRGPKGYGNQAWATTNKTYAASFIDKDKPALLRITLQPEQINKIMKDEYWSVKDPDPDIEYESEYEKEHPQMPDTIAFKHIPQSQIRVLSQKETSKELGKLDKDRNYTPPLLDVPVEDINLPAFIKE